ncbi:MAG: hypothetical protein ABIA11_00835 [Patescibacteria group bacterium]
MPVTKKVVPSKSTESTKAAKKDEKKSPAVNKVDVAMPKAKQPTKPAVTPKKDVKKPVQPINKKGVIAGPSRPKPLDSMIKEVADKQKANSKDIKKPAAKVSDSKKNNTILCLWVVVILLVLLSVALFFNREQQARTAPEEKPIPTTTAIVEVEESSATEQVPSNEQSVTEETPPANGEGSSAQEPETQEIVTELPTNLFRSPVGTTSVFNNLTDWLIAEPGVLLDATATFDRGSSTGEHYAQLPEGGFTYLSLGEGKIQSTGCGEIELPSGEGINNLVLIRGVIDDAQQDTDLNRTVKVTGYKPGHMSTSPMPAGAYVSKGWFLQQLEASSGENGQSGGNCGASGCSENHIHLIDVSTCFHQHFVTMKGQLENWEKVN